MALVHSINGVMGLECYQLCYNRLIAVDNELSSKEEAICFNTINANLNSTAISSITAIFSCVPDNKQKWQSEALLFNKSDLMYNKVLSIMNYFLYPGI